MDKKRIEKIRNGDLAELDEIYLEMKPKFINFVQTNFKMVPFDEIEDLYQETIIAFYQNIKKEKLIEINTSLLAYILKIGKNKLITYINEQKKFNDNIGFYAENAIAKDEYDNKIDTAVRFILNKMPDSCKKIINLFYFEKKSMDEIALILGYKNSDVAKSRKNKCISNLSDHANKIYLDDED
jgi:RNA polymerase sigma factor (sigma-70 family)